MNFFQQFDEHPSVKQAYAAQMEPVSLDSCLKAFTQPEELKDRDNYFCSNCKTHCPANKKLDIWKLPPILVLKFYSNDGETDSINFS